VVLFEVYIRGIAIVELKGDAPRAVHMHREADGIETFQRMKETVAEMAAPAYNKELVGDCVMMIASEAPLVQSAAHQSKRNAMSFLKSLFGLGGGKEQGGTAPAGAAKEAEHKGFMIRATPYKDGGQYQTAGTISKELGGEMKEYKFVRADRFSTLEEAADLSLSKGRQIIDEQGERMFN